jgi:hypothetical protein
VTGRAVMHGVLRWLASLFRGAPAPPRLEEERFPRDAAGRPYLTCFTRPANYYQGYIDDYLESLGSPKPSFEWQAHAYRKGVLGQWGLIARGPGEAFPFVHRLLRHPVAEARQAGVAVLDAWARDGGNFEVAALSAAEQELAAPSQTDIQTLTALLGMLGRVRSKSALPLIARVLRAPNSAMGDLDRSAIEALESISGEQFSQQSEPKHAAELWLRERGV